MSINLSRNQSFNKFNRIRKSINQINLQSMVNHQKMINEKKRSKNQDNYSSKKMVNQQERSNQQVDLCELPRFIKVQTDLTKADYIL